MDSRARAELAGPAATQAPAPSPARNLISSPAWAQQPPAAPRYASPAPQIPPQQQIPRLGEYTAWPGPNSNTFVATVLAAVPETGVTLPATAIGKDFPVDGRWIAEIANLNILLYGETRDEAIQRAQKAALEIIADRIERGTWPADAAHPGFAVAA